MSDPESFHKTNFSPVLAIVAMPIFFFILWGSSGFSVFGWDAIWYRDIAGEGYRFNGDALQQQNVAFLPGYPLLIYLLHAVSGIDVIPSQYIVSLACYIGGSTCFYKAFCSRFTAKQSLLAIVIFSINPFSIYLFNGYSETLFYLLCGAFFLSIERKRYWLSAIVLSYALVTRPHAVALYPVLIYRLAREQGIFDDGFRLSRAQAAAFVRSSADHLFLTLAFPVALTGFWYLRFNDSLLYVNALTAWGAAGSTSIYRQVGLLLSSLLDIQTMSISVFSGTVKLLAPYQFAAFNVLLNLIAMLYIAARKQHELVLFNGSLLAFWFLNSIPADSGRHGLLLLALPIAMSSALLSRWSEQTLQGGIGRPRVLLRAGLGLAIAGFLCLSLVHYVFYALIQLKGGWVS